MKATLSFKLPEEQEEFKSAFNGTLYQLAFNDVWDGLFRPRHKHGYGDQELDQLASENPRLMELLEERYRNIREELEERISGQ